MLENVAYPAVYVFLCVLAIVKRRSFAEQMSERSEGGDRLERLLIRAAGGDGSEPDAEERARAHQAILRRNEVLIAAIGAILLVAFAVWFALHLAGNPDAA